jgi:hypothetical protein
VATHTAPVALDDDAFAEAVAARVKEKIGAAAVPGMPPAAAAAAAAKRGGNAEGQAALAALRARPGPIQALKAPFKAIRRKAKSCTEKGREELEEEETQERLADREVKGGTMRAECDALEEVHGELLERQAAQLQRQTELAIRVRKTGDKSAATKRALGAIEQELKSIRLQITLNRAEYGQKRQILDQFMVADAAVRARQTAKLARAAGAGVAKDLAKGHSDVEDAADELDNNVDLADEFLNVADRMAGGGALAVRSIGDRLGDGDGARADADAFDDRIDSILAAAGHDELTRDGLLTDKFAAIAPPPSGRARVAAAGRTPGQKGHRYAQLVVGAEEVDDDDGGGAFAAGV